MAKTQNIHNEVTRLHDELVKKTKEQLIEEFTKIIRNPKECIIRDSLNEEIIKNIEALGPEQQDVMIEAFTNGKNISYVVEVPTQKNTLLVMVVNEYLNSIVGIKHGLKTRESDGILVDPNNEKYNIANTSEDITKELEKLNLEVRTNLSKEIRREDSIFWQFINDCEHKISHIKTTIHNEEEAISSIFVEFKNYCDTKVTNLENAAVEKATHIVEAKVAEITNALENLIVEKLVNEKAQQLQHTIENLNTQVQNEAQDTQKVGEHYEYND